jgi:hypothetical protein
MRQAHVRLFMHKECIIGLAISDVDRRLALAGFLNCLSACPAIVLLALTQVGVIDYDTDLEIMVTLQIVTCVCGLAHPYILFAVSPNSRKKFASDWLKVFKTG